MLNRLEENLDKILNDIDTNILPENILEGKTILGVTGTVIKLKGTRLEIQPNKTVQSNVPNNNFNGFTFVKVLPVTADIDTNISSNNIKSDVRILGVNGVLSSLTEDDYENALNLVIDILGSMIYVMKNNLIIKEPSYNINNDTLIINGEIINNTLKIN